MDRIDNRLRGGTNGARHRVTVIRRHDGGYVSEIAYTDDMLGTGGTMLRAISTLKNMGAKRIICAASLPFFSGGAIEAYD